MAKQSGLHQIRGKVGEHSYYRQSGVVNGLIRTINPGMSQRVKTDEAFANTRLNNEEFGQAGRVASCLIQHVTPKYRTMLLTFSQAKAAKKVLEQIKLDETKPWGERSYYDTTGEITSQILNTLAKTNFANLPIEFHKPANEGDPAVLAISASMAQYLQGIGCDGAFISVYNCRPVIGDYFGGYWPSIARKIQQVDLTYAVADGAVTEDIDPEFPAATPAGPNGHDVSFVLATVLPYKTVGSSNHIMQEFCTFGVVTPDIFEAAE